MTAHCAFLLVLGCCISTPDAPSPEAELEGTWVLVGGEGQRGRLSEEDAQKEDLICVIKCNRLTLVRYHKTESEFFFTVDPKQQPAVLDLVHANGKGINHAIYSLEGKKLTICVSHTFGPNKPEERPHKFTSDEKTNKSLPGLIVLIFERKTG